LLKQLVIDYPDSEWGYILLARGQIRLRRLDEAEASLAQALRLNPNSFQAHFRMGVLFQVKRDFKTATEWLLKTVELMPDSAVAYNNLGQCRFEVQDLAGAEKYFLKAVKVQPNFLDGHLRLVEFYAREHRFDAAQKSLKAAQNLQPENNRVIQAERLLKQAQQK
jgi:tetratricopeptide (TPR) repeat protein